MINIAVCDDNIKFLPRCVSAVKRNTENGIFDEKPALFRFTSAKGLMAWIDEFEERIDIIILDICLEENISGIDIAKDIHITHPETKIIFITAFIDRAADISEAEFCYFIYKRTDFDNKLDKAIFKAISEINRQKAEKLFTGSRYINFRDILYFEANKKTCIVHTSDEIIPHKASIGEISCILPDSFFCCHRSYIINFDNIDKIDKRHRQAVFINGEAISIPRAKTKETAEEYFNFLKRKAQNR